MARLIRHIYPGLICAIIIMVLCGLPGSYFPQVRTFWEWLGPDKIIHIFMFCVFAFSIIWGYRDEYCERDKSYRNVLQIVTLIVSVSYGALTELLQKYLFYGRYGCFYDFYADLIGCVLGIFIFNLAFRKKNCKKKSMIQ